MGISNNFSNEFGSAGYDWLKYILLPPSPPQRNPELSERHNESLSFARVQRMDQNIVLTLFNMLEKLGTKNNISDTHGNIWNIHKSSIQINKPDTVITEKGSRNVHVLTSREKSGNMRVKACCDVAGQFLPPVFVFKGVNKKQEFGDGSS